MAKRRAGVELTHDNWDEEEDQEEAGTFSVADQETLSKRPIIKARRRVAAQPDGSQAQTPFGAFKGFAGFGGATATAASSFSFKPVSTSPSTASQPSVTFGSAATALKAPSSDSGSKPTFSFKPSTSPNQATNMFQSSLKPAAGSTAAAANGSAKPAQTDESYATELKALNQSVSAWIRKHVEANPVCDLTPIFNDYKKHMSELEEKRVKKEMEGGSEGKAAVSPLSTSGQDKSSTVSSASSFTGFKFGSTTLGSSGVKEEEKKATTADKTAPKAGFSFGAIATENKGFTFGGSTSSTTSSSAAAGTSGNFSFGSFQAKPTTSNQAESENPDAPSDEPPKVEVKVVEEKDSLFSTRCKVFYKKDSEFKERGVGMLHVKDCGGSSQILVRADTNLGNIILNIGVSSSMLPTVTKQGKKKNNVMLLSPVNPPADKKCPKCNKNYLSPQESTACEEGCTADPTPLLLRVKTEAEADALIAEVTKICGD